MRFTSLLSLLPLTAAQLFGGAANNEAGSDLRNLNLTTTTTFPYTPTVNNNLRLLNGAPIPVIVSLQNNEASPVTIKLIGGSLWTPDTQTSLKNFTSKKINKKLKANEKYDVHYALQTDLREQEALLNIALAVATEKGEVVTVTAWNNTVVVREDQVSLLDPQVLFLYLILAAGLGAAGYAAYSAWAATLPKPKRKYDTPKPVPAAVVATGKVDESWIPEHHLKKTGSGTRVRQQGPKKA